VTFLESAPGASFGKDKRQAEGKPYYEHWVTLFPQSEGDHQVHLFYGDREITSMGYSTKTYTYPRQQPSYKTKDSLDLLSLVKPCEHLQDTSSWDEVVTKPPLATTASWSATTMNGTGFVAS